MALPKLYERVVLNKDHLEHGLKSGDVATLVDYVPHPRGGPQGAILEVFNAVGESIMVVAVSSEDIEHLKEDEIPAVRRLSATA
jgi:hypothetical protein